MIKSKYYLPRIFRKSRDLQVFLRLIDILHNVNMYDTEHLTDLVSFDRCPDKFLPGLFSFEGYKYDDTLSCRQNRLIIKNFRDLIKNRGSDTGIKNALALAVASKDEVTPSELIGLSKIFVEYNYEEGLILVYYPPEQAATRDLLEVVRPIGMGIKFIPSDVAIIYSKIIVYDRRKIAQYNYSSQVVGHSEVGHAESNPGGKDDN